MANNCIVCGLEEGWCEFCPKKPLINRDPGDENDCTGYIEDTHGTLQHDGDTCPVHEDPFISSRSYKATFQLADSFMCRTFIGFDSFTETVVLATKLQREGERLIGLTELA